MSSKKDTERSPGNTPVTQEAAEITYQHSFEVVVLLHETKIISRSSLFLPERDYFPKLRGCSSRNTSMTTPQPGPQAVPAGRRAVPLHSMVNVAVDITTSYTHTPWAAAAALHSHCSAMDGLGREFYWHLAVLTPSFHLKFTQCNS